MFIMHSRCTSFPQHLDVASCFSYQSSVISFTEFSCPRMSSEMLLVITLKYFCMRDIATRALHMRMCAYTCMHAYCVCTTSSHIVRPAIPSLLPPGLQVTPLSEFIELGSTTKEVFPPSCHLGKFPNLWTNFNCC